MGPLTGRLVVATHELTDRNFRRAVVLVLAHDGQQGAAGVVLNHPTPADIPLRLRPWAALAAPPAVMFRGGPVDRDTVIGLAGPVGAGDPDATDRTGWQRLTDGVGVIDLSSDAGTQQSRVRWVRLFSGYAGWGGGQLEGEIVAGAWYVVDVDPADACTAEPEHLWRAVLARQGGLFRTVPDDPALN